jgi:hypothetical protein
MTHLISPINMSPYSASLPARPPKVAVGASVPGRCSMSPSMADEGRRDTGRDFGTGFEAVGSGP